MVELVLLLGVRFTKPCNGFLVPTMPYTRPWAVCCNGGFVVLRPYSGARLCGVLNVPPTKALQGLGWGGGVELVWAGEISVQKREMYRLRLAGHCGTSAGPLNPCKRGKTYMASNTRPGPLSGTPLL